MTPRAEHQPGAVESASWSEGVEGFLREALGAPFAPGELRMITLPAPRARPERLLALRTSEPGVFWAERSRGDEAPTATAGAGVAHLISATGADRFDDVRADADRLWPRVRTLAHPETTARAPRLFGGFAFLPGARPAPWERFGDAAFILPRLLYTRDPTAAALSVTVGGRDGRGEAADAIVRRVGHALDTLATAEPGEDLPAGAVTAEVIEGMSESAWKDAVASIRGLIAGGRAAKVVAARRTVLRLDAAPDPVLVLSRLYRASSPEIRFALRCGPATFLGATPEHLISRRGLAVRTEALAGSMGVGHPEELLASAKDAEEHALVVEAIADALFPLCDRLDHPVEPVIQRLRHVLHLQTPFEGRLARPVHVLDLLERLHPTPAVAGTPTAEALEWIASHEPADRGWFAAPVGWFDEAGDGDFVVALRSGLLHGDRAYLYAGAGIVRDSDPAAEYAETETKLKTMMNALGFAG